MAEKLCHVTASVNRDSIRQHGLDWTRTGGWWTCVFQLRLMGGVAVPRGDWDRAPTLHESFFRSCRSPERRRLDGSSVRRRDRHGGRGGRGGQPLRREQSHPPEVVRLPAVSGEGGIRTLDAPFGHARDFQSRSFGQLGHLSALDGAYRRRQDPATLETYAATSWICWGVNVPLNEGIGDLPFVTRSTTLS